jgi:hypothetical protein
VLNEEMIAAGIRVFVGGLHPVKWAKSLWVQPSGKVPSTDGPYLETKQPKVGFWLLSPLPRDAKGKSFSGELRA